MKKEKKVSSITKESGKKGAAIALAATMFLSGMSGCAMQPNTNDGSGCIDMPAIEQPAEKTIEEKWQEAKETEKKLIREWYKREIADASTLRNLFEPKIGFVLPESCCKLNSNHLPDYTITRSLVEDIPQLINSYCDTLDSISVSDLSIETDEDIEKELIKLRQEFGIVLNGNNISFANIPTFENETEEIMNRVYFIEGIIWNTLVSNINLDETNDTYTRVERCMGEENSFNRYIDSSYKDEVNSSSKVSFDTIWCTPVQKKDIVEFKKNGKPIDVIYISADELMENLAPIFVGDEDFRKMCEEFNLDTVLTMLDEEENKIPVDVVVKSLRFKK